MRGMENMGTLHLLLFSQKPEPIQKVKSVFKHLKLQITYCFKRILPWNLLVQTLMLTFLINWAVFQLLLKLRTIIYDKLASAKTGGGKGILTQAFLLYVNPEFFFYHTY